MQVINLDQNGNEIDLTKIVVPLNNAAYDVCRRYLEKRDSDVRESNQSSVSEKQT